MIRIKQLIRDLIDSLDDKHYEDAMQAALQILIIVEQEYGIK